MIVGALLMTMVNFAAPRYFRTLTDSTYSRSAQESGTHQDHPNDRMHSSSSETSMRPNGHGKLRQPPVRAVTRNVDGPTDSILADGQSDGGGAPLVPYVGGLTG